MADDRLRMIRIMALILSVLPAGESLARESPVCPPTDKIVTVEVRFDQAQPFVDDSQSRSWIQGRARALHHPIGLTVSRLAHTLTAQFETGSTADHQRQCVTLRSVSLALGYPSTRIYIANEYRPGSCAYQAIHRHEMEHVRILNHFQEKVLPIWRAHLHTLVQAYERKPLLSTEPHKTQQQVLHELDQAVRKEIQHLDKEQKAAQAAIDTPQNYAKVRASCPQW